MFSTAEVAVPKELLSASAVDHLVKEGFARPVGRWLAGSAAIIFGVVLLGGWTRLTRSGLSMTDWDFRGKALPTTKEEWETEFAKYKATPEFEKVHALMTLEEFKFIYFNEWFHRWAGRGIGVVFAAGLTYFLARRALKLPMLARLGVLFCLGGGQGLIGWWMVRSGLKEETLVNKKDPRVSPYRLATHLTMATTLYSAVLWNALTLLRPSPMALQLGGLPPSADPHAALRACGKLRAAAWPLAALAGITFVSGAFVAGNDAGRAYNTWPKMLDDWVPPEWIESVRGLPEKWRRFFEDTPTVQFDHRMLAYSTVAYAGVVHHLAKRLPLTPAVRFAALLPAVVAVCQMTLGITTLLMYVPVPLSVAHQGGGLLMVSSAAFLCHTLRRPNPALVNALKNAVKH